GLLGRMGWERIGPKEQSAGPANPPGSKPRLELTWDSRGLRDRGQRRRAIRSRRTDLVKIQHPVVVQAVGVTGAWVVRYLVGTCRFHFRYADPQVNPEVARRLGRRY